MKVVESQQIIQNKNKFILTKGDKFLKEKFINMLKKELNPAFLTFNFISISQEKTDWNKTLSYIETIPMMDNKKIIYF